MKITPLIMARLSALNRKQLYRLLQQVPNAAPAGMFRATDDALRSAASTLLYVGRLNEDHLIKAELS